MSSFEEYIEKAVPRIISKSNDIRQRDLNETQKKLYSLVMEIFAFSANTVTKLNERTEANMISLLEELDDHLNQWGKLDTNL